MRDETKKIKVAIIGLGNIGKALAANFSKGNQPVMVASREIEKSEAFAKGLGNMVIAKETVDAIQEADVIIPTIYFDRLKEFFKMYAAELDGKIIIDVSNPIAPDGNGGFTKIIDENDSAAKILSDLVPKNAKLIKAFGTLGAASLSGEAFQKPDRKVLFYASDSTNSQEVVENLITSSGFVPLHIGGLVHAIRIEVFGDLHEFGALGKTVTLPEAIQKI